MRSLWGIYYIYIYKETRRDAKSLKGVFLYFPFDEQESFSLSTQNLAKNFSIKQTWLIQINSR